MAIPSNKPDEPPSPQERAQIKRHLLSKLFYLFVLGPGTLAIALKMGLAHQFPQASALSALGAGFIAVPLIFIARTISYLSGKTLHTHKKDEARSKEYKQAVNKTFYWLLFAAAVLGPGLWGAAIAKKIQGDIAGTVLFSVCSMAFLPPTLYALVKQVDRYTKEEFRSFVPSDD